MLVAAISDHFKLDWIQINFTKKEKIYMVENSNINFIYSENLYYVVFFTYSEPLLTLTTL